MEQILDLYTHPYDPKRPVICMDETNRQLIKEVKPTLPIKPGQVEKYDHHYQRAGVCQLFLFFEPLRGWRQVIPRERRTKKDWVLCLAEILDQYGKAINVMRVVLDNLNIHDPAAFYEVFPPEQARQYLRRLEFYYTPVHASWLNMAEIDLSVLVRQCLKRRIPTLTEMAQEVSAWNRRRNKSCKLVDWQFTTEDARIKLKSLYPAYLL